MQPGSARTPTKRLLLRQVPHARPSPTAGSSRQRVPQLNRAGGGGPAEDRRPVVKRPDGLPIYLTAIEAADLLRTTRKAIYVMIERRRLPGVKKIGRRVLIHTQTLLSWLDQQGAPSLQEIQR